MKIIEGYEKDMILQAVNFWANDLNKGVLNIAEMEDKGEQVPPALAGLVCENAERVSKLYENLEQLFEKTVVALEDFEFDELVDSFPIGD
jgi:hypothetical protein